MALDLGVVTAPRGTLLVLDPGYLKFWRGDRRPVLPEGVLSTPEATAAAHSSVDLEIVGADAGQVGRELDRQWHPRFLFDIPRAGVEDVSRRVADISKARGLDARVEVLLDRMSHRRRVDLALEAGGGAGEVQFHGIWAGVLGGVPGDRALRVIGERMPDGHAEAGRLRRVSLVVDEGSVARSERFAYAMVDWGCLVAIDVEAAGEWQDERTLDGKADFVFWGRDAEAIAALTSAGRLDDTNFGWVDLPEERADELSREVFRLRDERRAVFATDYRPHTHLYPLMTQIRASKTSSGVVQLGGAIACGFATSWGDGIFEVHRDLDESGRLLRVRIELGTDERVALMGKLKLRWNTSALVSRMVIDEGQPVRFMYREAPHREQDSGWRMFCGYEDEKYSDDPKNIAIVALTEFANRDKRVDALLDEPAGSVFERRPGEEGFQRVTDWTPGR